MKPSQTNMQIAIDQIKGATADLKKSNDEAELMERDRMREKHPQEQYHSNFEQDERDYG